MAVNDDLIRKNPFDFKTSDAVINNAKVREALTPEQEKVYMGFVKQDPHFSQYYDAIYILFHTGLRISEFAGLTIADVDMKNRKIIVDHQLLKEPGRGCYISDTKTSSGEREIPMSDSVCSCFHRLIANRSTPKIMQIIDGKSGFFFLGKNGMPLTGQDWTNRFRGIWTKFCKTGEVQMPKVTPHVCRHTFCSNMAKSGMNPKALQYIMGHANVSITLDTYTHVGFRDAEMEMRRVAGGGYTT